MSPLVSTDRDGWHYDPPEPCGGVSINGAPPRCCEVHMLPWGHAPIDPAPVGSDEGSDQ